jgi:hypothetical protein
MTNQTCYEAREILGLADEIVKLRLGQQPDVKCHVELGAYFRSRTLCDAEEPAELHLSSSIETLSDVGHHRDGCSTDLVAKGEVLGKWTGAGDTVDRRSQHACFAPRLEVLEPSYGCHLGADTSNAAHGGGSPMRLAITVTPALPHPGVADSLPHSRTHALPHSYTPVLPLSRTHALPHSRTLRGGAHVSG